MSCSTDPRAFLIIASKRSFPYSVFSSVIASVTPSVNVSTVSPGPSGKIASSYSVSGTIPSGRPEVFRPICSIEPLFLQRSGDRCPALTTVMVWAVESRTITRNVTKR